MATVSGVWVWNETIDFSSVIIGSNGWQTIPVNFTSNGEEYTSITVRQYMRESQRDMEYDSITVYPYQSNAFTDENYRTVDFGSEPQTIISDRFYNFFIANATQQAEPVPTPDWANCFVKTASGNKAVEKVWIKQNGQLVTVYEAQEPEPQVIGPYLTFKSDTPFTLNAIAPSFGSKWDGILEYSTDTITWTEWNKEIISSGKFNTLYLRGEDNTTMGRPFELTGDEISAYGNIENLLDYKIVASGGHPTMKVNAFERLFGGSNLVRPPSLGFITVASYACMRMFRGCTKLKVLPLIHATSIGQTSLAYMFDGCKNIKLSTTKTEEYKYEWRIPQQGTTSSLGNYWNNKTFINTGGTFTGSPSANTTYYTTEEPV